jgi:hypothetical protein
MQIGYGYDAACYKFTGKERDAESGLDYFGARYNASSAGGPAFDFDCATPTGGCPVLRALGEGRESEMLARRRPFTCMGSKRIHPNPARKQEISLRYTFPPKAGADGAREL